jgi:thioredoxin 1
MSSIAVTKDSFKSEVLDSEQVVLTDFWASWCMPCRMMDPVVEKLAEQYAGKLKIAKVNVDEEGELAAQYNIVSIPTFLFFHEGKLVNQTVGAVPEKALNDIIKDYV